MLISDVIARFTIPATRTPQSTLLQCHQIRAKQHHDSHNTRDGPHARCSTRKRRPLLMALRTLPLPSPESKQPHRRLLLRFPSLLSPQLPRNASLGMAIPLRRPRSPKVLLRHRLLLSHPRLGCQHPHLAETFPKPLDPR